MTRGVQITNEHFVRSWQSSESLEDVLTATGLTKHHALARAGRLRKHGVPLKEHKRIDGRGTRVDWDALKKLAEESVTE
jgi:hypothetical protein